MFSLLTLSNPHYEILIWRTDEKIKYSRTRQRMPSRTCQAKFSEETLSQSALSIQLFTGHHSTTIPSSTLRISRRACRTNRDLTPWGRVKTETETEGKTWVLLLHFEVETMASLSSTSTSLLRSTPATDYRRLAYCNCWKSLPWESEAKAKSKAKIKTEILHTVTLILLLADPKPFISSPAKAWFLLPTRGTSQNKNNLASNPTVNRWPRLCNCIQPTTASNCTSSFCFSELKTCSGGDMQIESSQPP